MQISRNGTIFGTAEEIEQYIDTEIKNAKKTIKQQLIELRKIEEDIAAFDEKIESLDKEIARLEMNEYGFSISSARYIKLGKNGCWANESFGNSFVRIGWVNIPSELINSRNWDEVYKINLQDFNGNKGACRADVNALKGIVESSSDTVFITFEGSKLYWTISNGKNIVEGQESSKHIKVQRPWTCLDVCGYPLSIDKLNGNLSKISRFAGTSCKVHAIKELKLAILYEVSDSARNIQKALNQLEIELENGIRSLHWKDFELLIDLIFQRTSWRRVSVLGESLKDVDLILQDVLTNERKVVQIKSNATINDFKKFISIYDVNLCGKMIFVTHSDVEQFNRKLQYDYSCIELWDCKKITKLAISFGLVEWIKNKI